MDIRTKLMHAIFGRPTMPTPEEIRHCIELELKHKPLGTIRDRMRYALEARLGLQPDPPSLSTLEDMTLLNRRAIREYEVRVLRRLGR